MKKPNRMEIASSVEPSCWQCWSRASREHGCWNSQPLPGWSGILVGRNSLHLLGWKCGELDGGAGIMELWVRCLSFNLRDPMYSKVLKFTHYKLCLSASGNGTEHGATQKRSMSWTVDVCAELLGKSVCSKPPRRCERKEAKSNFKGSKEHWRVPSMKLSAS